MTEYHSPDALHQASSLSAWAAEPHRDLVILAEGNASFKVGRSMLIKGSGAAMGSGGITEFVEVDRLRLSTLLDGGEVPDDEVAAELLAARSWGSRRPSVETLLHVVCQSFDAITAVLHTHPTPVNALLCSTAADLLVSGSYFPDQIVTLGTNPMLVPYVDPGLPLAQLVQRMIREHVNRTGATPKVIYLQNHGMFALGGSAAEAIQLTQMAVKTAQVIIGATTVGGVVPLSREQVHRIDTRPDELLRRYELRER